jgi:hypothetical protein
MDRASRLVRLYSPVGDPRQLTIFIGLSLIVFSPRRMCYTKEGLPEAQPILSLDLNLAAGSTGKGALPLSRKSNPREGMIFVHQTIFEKGPHGTRG